MTILSAAIIGQFDVEEFTASMQKFMETSTLGEFLYRLHVLDGFRMELLQKGKSLHNSNAECERFVLVRLLGQVFYFCVTGFVKIRLIASTWSCSSESLYTQKCYMR